RRGRAYFSSESFLPWLRRREVMETYQAPCRSEMPWSFAGRFVYPPVSCSSTRGCRGRSASRALFGGARARSVRRSGAVEMRCGAELAHVTVEHNLAKGSAP